MIKKLTSWWLSFDRIGPHRCLWSLLSGKQQNQPNGDLVYKHLVTNLMGLCLVSREKGDGDLCLSRTASLKTI